MSESNSMIPFHLHGNYEEGLSDWLGRREGSSGQGYVPMQGEYCVNVNHITNLIMGFSNE